MKTPKRPISAGLVELAQPWLEITGTNPWETNLEPLFRSLSILWNAIVLEQRLGGSGEVTAQLAVMLVPPDAPASFRARVIEVIAAKRAESPFDDRIVAETTLIPGEGSEFRLQASAAPFATVDADALLQSMKKHLGAL